MLYFIDQTSEKDHHMVFNSSIIQILMLIYPDQKLIYYGIESNQNSVLSLLSAAEKEKITCQKIVYSKPINDHKFFKFLNFITKERLRLKLFKKMIVATTPKDLVFLSITTFSSFYFFKQMKRKFDVNTIATLHGDIDFLYNSSNLYEKLNAFFHKKIFKIKAENFYYLLLNKISKSRLVKDGFLAAKEILEINHPYILNCNNLSDDYINDGRPIIFGHIGSMEIDRKNSHLFYQLAFNLSDLIKKNEINFNTIGLITPQVLPYKNKYVLEIVGNSAPNKPDYLTRGEYEFNVLKLQFALFFFKKPHYIFRASGAVIDAIAFQIPVIAFNHPFFENLFSQSGPIGYLCKNVEEMEKKIRKIALKDKEVKAEFLVFKSNLAKLRTLFVPSQIVLDIKSQMHI